MRWWRTELGLGIAAGGAACDLCSVTSAVKARGDAKAPPLAVLEAAASATTAVTGSSPRTALPIFHEVDGTRLVADWRLHAGISASF